MHQFHIHNPELSNSCSEQRDHGDVECTTFTNLTHQYQTRAVSGSYISSEGVDISGIQWTLSEI